MNMKLIGWRARALAGLAMAGVVVAGCGDGEPEPSAPAKEASSFAAPVEGSDAFVGAVVNDHDGRVLAYVCDGTTVATWFTGEADEEGNVSLSSRDGASLTGRIAGGRLSGTVALPGAAAAHRFSAPAVTDPAGLYRLKGEVGGQAAVGGWVVLADGRQKGAVRTSSGFTSSDTDLARPAKPVSSFTSNESDF